MRHSLALLLLFQLNAAVVVTSYLKVCQRLESKTRSTSKHRCPNILLAAKSNNEDLDSLKLNFDTLSDKEKDRLQFIQKLNNEADEFAKKAGFDLSSDDDLVQRSVADTDWSGAITASVIHTRYLKTTE